MKKTKEYINLLPREEKGPSRISWTGIFLMALFILGWCGAYGWQFYTAWTLQNQHDTLAARKQALMREAESIAGELGIVAPSGTGEGKAALIHSLLEERVLWSEVFKQFSFIVPKGLWFDNLEGSTGGKAEIKIKGGAFNYLSVAEFMLAMERSVYFEKPQLSYAQKAVVQGQDVIGFEITCGIRKRGMK